MEHGVFVVVVVIDNNHEIEYCEGKTNMSVEVFTEEKDHHRKAKKIERDRLFSLHWVHAKVNSSDATLTHDDHIVDDPTFFFDWLLILFSSWGRNVLHHTISFMFPR